MKPVDSNLELENHYVHHTLLAKLVKGLSQHHCEDSEPPVESTQLWIVRDMENWMTFSINLPQGILHIV